MTIEEFRDFANCLKNNYTIDFDKLPEFCDMAISALPEEGAELIDRRQIKWYGCDHEGHIKGIDCDTADCSKCFFATVEHDEVMSLPVYRIPDSTENKGEWIPVSERLPEESKNYLVVIRERFNKDHWWIDICDIDTDGFAKTWNVREPYYVEAWQPLPEPYKGGDS